MKMNIVEQKHTSCFWSKHQTSCRNSWWWHYPIG